MIILNTYYKSYTGDQLVYCNHFIFNEIKEWFEENLSKENYRIICDNAGGNFYIAVMVFQNEEDLNLFRLKFSDSLNFTINDDTIIK